MSFHGITPPFQKIWLLKPLKKPKIVKIAIAVKTTTFILPLLLLLLGSPFSVFFPNAFKRVEVKPLIRDLELIPRILFPAFPFAFIFSIIFQPPKMCKGERGI